MSRALAVGLALACLAAAPAWADDEDLAGQRLLESLHPFGVRGLPTAYDGCARPDERRVAIQRGIDWLTAHQADDGSWRPYELGWCFGKHNESKAPDGKGKALYTVGVTGMVAAAYLGAGYTHRGKHPQHAALRRALIWLVKQQDDKGCIGLRETQQYVYNHAFATLALVEAYALTLDPKLQGPAQKALDFVKAARNPYFAWRYGVKPGDNDTSLTGCMGMPIYIASRLNRAGERAGVVNPLPIDQGAFSGIRSWLDKVTDDYTGRVGYVQRGTGPARPMEHVDEFPGEKSESCTAIGVLMRYLLPDPALSKKEQEASDRLRDRSVKCMRAVLPRWDPKGGTIDMYYWYYGTMAMRQVGGAAWAEWDAAVTEALLQGQALAGDACGAHGSWDPLAVWAKGDGGRIYATAIALLTLQTPDRMRPLPDDRSDLKRALEAGIEDPQKLASVLRGVGVLRVPGVSDVLPRYIAHPETEVAAAAAGALGYVEADGKTIRALGARLDDPSVEVRRAVARALAGQGKRAAPLAQALVARLDDKDARVAAAAAHALGEAGVAEVAPQLVARLEGGSPSLRVAAASALHRLTGDVTKARPILLQGLGSDEAWTRREAARAFERMTPDLGDAEAALTKALTDKDVRVTVHAAGALHGAGKQREASVAAWVAALGASAARVRIDAMERLQKVRAPSAVPMLARQIMDGATPLRVKAAQVLAALGKAARPAAAELAWCSLEGPMALRDIAAAAYAGLDMDPAAAKAHVLDGLEVKDRRVLEGTVEVLVRLGSAVVPVVQQKIATSDATTRAWMLEVLRRLGPEASAAVPDLGRLVEAADDPRTRSRAARALAAMGTAAAPALGALEFALQHEKAFVRTAALDAIGAIAPSSSEAVAILTRVASETDKKQQPMRLAALRAMGGLGKRGEDVFDTLIAALQDGDVKVREASILTFVDLYEHIEKPLLKHTDHDSIRVRDGICFVVQRKGAAAERFAKPLSKSLEARAPTGNSKTGDALAAIGKPAVSSLIKLLKSKKPNVRGEAARALGVIGADAKRALKRIKRLGNDPDFGVQLKARRAVERIEAALAAR